METKHPLNYVLDCYHCSLTSWVKSVTAILFLVINSAVVAQQNDFIDSEELFNMSPNQIIDSLVREKHVFHGLAGYYNRVDYYVVDQNDVRDISEGDEIELKENQWLSIVGRFNVLLIKQSGLLFSVHESELIINNPEVITQNDSTIELIDKSQLKSIFEGSNQLRYFQLWKPLAFIAKLMEATLVAIQNNITQYWGLVVIIFSVLIKLLLTPLALWTSKLQSRVNQINAELAPKLKKIKKDYDGEDAHNRLMAAHQEIGVSPFYTLKPMVTTLIQIPILISVFNVLGEMPQFSNQSFLWIKDLAYPDAFNAATLGASVNLLPIIMTLVAVFAIALSETKLGKTSFGFKDKSVGLFLMAGVFFLMFYPFPAVMVLYWTMVNLLPMLLKIVMQNSRLKLT